MYEFTKTTFKYVLIFIILSMMFTLAVNIMIVKTSEAFIYDDTDDFPDRPVIIVLGAYVRGDNLSMVLADRVDVALRLYKNGVDKKLLLSGDHGRLDYDEVNGMRKYILKDDQISEEDIFLDHAGFDTYDSMYRAQAVFDVESAVIVTQDFHMARAVYIARALGIDAVGYSVNQNKYKAELQAKWAMRESLARVKAFFDVLVHSEPKYLGQVIPITGDGRLSWDEFE